MKKLILFSFLLFLASHVAADEKDPLFPGAQYDPAVPTPKSYLGYGMGEYFTDHYQMEGYLKLLQETVPARMKIFHIGQSIERRNMYIVAISAPENIQDLEKNRQEVARLRNPRETDPARAKVIAGETPLIAWMNFANDGNESAAFEACLQVAYHFAAGQDSLTNAILQNVIILLNPAHNPESHQRYVAWMKASVVGPNGTADPFAAEHRGDWRMSTNNNHYQIDLNRDAFAASQKETRIVVENLHRWNPQVFVDFHGETNEYFFAPFATPMNLNLPATTRKWATVIGRNNAKAFDRHGWSYFAREVFDLHYPGYWDSYPALNGAIGMTYETDGGGRKGLQFERPDKTILTFREAIHHHVTTCIATLQTAAENREDMLQDYYAFFESGMEEGRNEKIKQVVLVPGRDTGLLEDLVALLQRHGIEVFRATEAFRTDGAEEYLSGRSARKSFPAGCYIVPFDQPQKRLAKALLERNAGLEAEFLEEARANYAYNKSTGEKAPKERLGFYDVTAWSLPLAYGVEAYGLEKPFKGAMEKAPSANMASANEPLQRAGYAYVFDIGTNAGYKLMAQLLQEDFKVAVATRPFKTNNREFPRGSAIVRVERNPESLHARIATLAQECKAEVTPMATGWTSEGIFLGSNHVINLKKPKIAVICEEPVRQTSYGAIWYLLEKRFGYGFTALRLEYFQRVDLSRYNVIVLPPGSAAGYKRAFGEAGIKKLRTWIQNGGVFVGVKDGAAFAADPKVNFTTARLVGQTPPAPAAEEKYGSEKEAPAEKPAQAQKEEKPDFTPGAVFKVALDERHFLTLGYGKEIPALVYSSLIFKPSKQGANVGVFAKEGTKVSGFVWDKTLEMFPGKAYLIHEPLGRGKVVLFAEEPIFRLFWRGLERLFLNSLFMSPSFASTSRP